MVLSDSVRWLTDAIGLRDQNELSMLISMGIDFEHCQ
jgi:hypothetical protein